MQKAEAYEKGERAAARPKPRSSRFRTAPWQGGPRRGGARGSRATSQAELPAKAQKARIVVDAEAEAEKRRLEAEGEASAIFAKLEAEARGHYEILAKKGEGLKCIVEARGGASRRSSS